MTTLDQMVAIIATQSNTVVRLVPQDLLRVYPKHTRTAEQLVNDYPKKYRGDLVGFELIGDTYEPRFATLQAEWDAELKEYYADKAEWCRKYGCD